MDEIRVGVLAGVVAAIIWAVGAYLYRRYCVSADFHDLADEYTVRKKRRAEPESDTTKIRVAGNVLRVTQEGFEEGGSAKGEIQMDTSDVRSGKGQYVHDKPGPPILFGFWDVQVMDRDTILVHTTYASTNDTLVFQGYVWERRKP
jgi:hypothetical protein